MTNAEMANRAKEIRELYVGGAKICDLCKKYGLSTNYLNQIIENYQFSSQEYVKRFEKKKVKKLICQLKSGGVPLYLITNIIFKIYGRKLSINTIRSWTTGTEKNKE